MKLPDKAYDVLKEIALVWLPAATTLWVTLAKIWNWPLVVEVAGTLSAIDTFLGAILKISTVAYNKEKNSVDLFEGVDGKDD